MHFGSDSHLSLTDIAVLLCRYSKLYYLFQDVEQKRAGQYFFLEDY